MWLRRHFEQLAQLLLQYLNAAHHSSQRRFMDYGHKLDGIGAKESPPPRQSHPDELLGFFRARHERGDDGTGIRGRLQFGFGQLMDTQTYDAMLG